MRTETMKVEMWPIDRLQPYDKNPRLNDGAVNAVAEASPVAVNAVQRPRYPTPPPARFGFRPPPLARFPRPPALPTYRPRSAFPPPPRQFWSAPRPYAPRPSSSSSSLSASR